MLPLHIHALGGDEAFVGELLFAGAAGTLLSVGYAGKLLTRFKPGFLAALGGGFYAFGALLFVITSSLSPLLHFASIFLGAGWSLAFTLGPVLLSNMVDDARRSFYFSILSAFNMLGMGMAPVLTKWALANGVTYAWIFGYASLLATLGGLLFGLAGHKCQVATSSESRSIGEWRAIRTILSSEARYPILMVLLGACVFSSMMNFQTTFAKAQGLDFAIFFIVYSGAVIVSRFLLSGWVGRRNPFFASTCLLFLMCISIGMFGLVGIFPWLYAACAALLGISYGLVYPLIQALSVNLSKPFIRSRVVVYFSLSYFVGVYVFPFIGGHVIVRYGYNGMLIVLFILAILELLVSLRSLKRHLLFQNHFENL